MGKNKNNPMTRNEEHVTHRVLRLVRGHVDKYASLDESSLVISYYDRRTKKHMYMGWPKMLELYEDMWGDCKNRWKVSHDLLVFNTNVKRVAHERGLCYATVRAHFCEHGNWEV